MIYNILLFTRLVNFMNKIIIKKYKNKSVSFQIYSNNNLHSAIEIFYNKINMVINNKNIYSQTANKITIDSPITNFSANIIKISASNNISFQTSGSSLDIFSNKCILKTKYLYKKSENNFKIKSNLISFNNY